MDEPRLLWVDNAERKDVRQMSVRSHVARVSHRRRFRQQKLRSGQSPRAASEDPSNEGIQPSEPPGSVVAWHGNSDPFQSQSIAITPLISRLLDFLLHVWIPAIHMQSSNKIEEELRLCVERTTAQTYIDPLQQEWSACATLLPCATILAKLSPGVELKQQRAVLKLKTIARLKATIEEDTEQTDDRLMWLTHALFVDAISNGDLVEATSHGKVLQWMMRRKTDRDGLESLDMNLLHRTLSHEVYRSDLTTTHSVFDIHTWTTAVLKAHYQETVDIVESQKPSFLQNLDESIRGTALGDICAELHAGFYLWSKGLFSEVDAQAASRRWAWATIKFSIRELRSMDYYVQARDLAQMHEVIAPHTSRYWHTQACLALGVQLCQVAHLTDPRFAGHSYWPRGKTLSSVLQKHMMQAARGGKRTSNDTAALLFAAWAGVTWILKESLHSNNTLREPYFGETFGTAALALEIRSWSDIVSVIDRFIPVKYYGEAYRSSQDQPSDIQKYFEALLLA